MIGSSVTVSLVPEARGGPFIFWEDLPEACRQASRLGFDAIEVFARGARELDADLLARLLDDHGLKLAALGTGAGWLLHRYSLSHPDSNVRREAIQFVTDIIDVAGRFQASAIVGSMQGRAEDAASRPDALERLAASVADLADHAAGYGVPLLYEPLNRYETNLLNRIGDTINWLNRHQLANVRILADLFHMNIEETSIVGALREGGSRIGHIHFVDSNRCAPSLGHIDYRPIAAALSEVRFSGYLSAEALPYPDSLTAAMRTINAFSEFFKNNQ